MKSINASKKFGILTTFRNRKGFSLIEMAIVLVIIGIIIGAILKGQDLILNSRAKQITAAVTTWRNLAAAYLDRTGRLPGDSVNDGRIGNDAAEIEAVAGLGTAISELATTMANAPENPVIVGGMSFYVFFGNVVGASGFRNVIVVCKDPTCAVTFNKDELEVIKTIDTAVDGSADGGLGQFRSAVSATLAPTIVAAAGARSNEVVTAAPASLSVLGATATTTPWTTASAAAFWSFDRPF